MFYMFYSHSHVNHVAHVSLINKRKWWWWWWWLHNRCRTCFSLFLMFLLKYKTYFMFFYSKMYVLTTMVNTVTINKCEQFNSEISTLVPYVLNIENLPISGVELDVSGILLRRSSWKIVNESKIVIWSEVFSPLSGGSQKTSIMIRERRMHGKINVKTK